MTTRVVNLGRGQRMTDPEGTLTAAQHEILQAIWNAPKSGATVTEIWQAIGELRGITRTTVLNQVDRTDLAEPTESTSLLSNKRMFSF